MDGYKTVKGFALAEYEEHRSRFIGAVKPVKTEAEALAFIEARKKESFGARHNVYAYVLRENNITRYSDDGEPHSTAGVPTLDVLKKGEITDCCIVTTRYFGGILLGTGGLVRAYTAAAKMAVEAAGIAVMKECAICNAVCSYADYQLIEQLILDFGGKVLDTDFTDLVKVEFSVEHNVFDALCQKARDVFCGRVVPEITGTNFAEV